MMFKTDKCKSLHFGNKNVKSVYLLGDKSIRADEEEKDLGVIIHQSLKSTNQCVTAAKSANKTLGMISGTFENKDTRIMLKLYQSLVRPKLVEYCAQAWRPYLKKDIEMLQKVQKRAKRLTFRDKNLSW